MTEIGLVIQSNYSVGITEVPLTTTPSNCELLIILTLTGSAADNKNFLFAAGKRGGGIPTSYVSNVLMNSKDLFTNLSSIEYPRRI